HRRRRHLLPPADPRRHRAGAAACGPGAGGQPGAEQGRELINEPCGVRFRADTGLSSAVEEGRISAKLGHWPDYSITPSARTKNVSETARPSILAVLRLTMSSKFVGCSIGRSAGFAPLRMRSTKY